MEIETLKSVKLPAFRLSACTCAEKFRYPYVWVETQMWPACKTCTKPVKQLSIWYKWRKLYRGISGNGRKTIEEMLSLYGWDAVEPVGRNWTILPKWYTHRWKAYHAPELAKKMGRAIEDAPASWQAAGIQSLPLPERGIKSSEEGKGGTGGKDTKAGTHTHGSKNTKDSKNKNKRDKGGKGKGKNGANSFQSTF